VSRMTNYSVSTALQLTITSHDSLSSLCIITQVRESHTCEVVTFVKGTVIRCAEDSEDMYAAIDAVTDRLAQKLKRYKQRRLDGYHGGPHMGENLANVLEEISVADDEEQAAGEDYVDLEAPTITKIKR